MKRVDFRTLYGKLGIWPGDMGPQEASIIFDQAMLQRDGATFLEINPGTGRTTVMLGTAAKNLGGKLFLAGEWANANPEEQRWLGRAIALHGLKDHVQALPDSSNVTIKKTLNGGGLDIVLVNGEFPRTEFLPTHKGTLVITRRTKEDVRNAELMADHRPAIALWRVSEDHKPVAVVAEVASI